MLSIFSCAHWPSVCLLWRNVYLGLLPIFWLGCLGGFLLLSCMKCLYILEIKPLLVTSFANIFSQSIGCLFILLMASFAVQKLISLIRSHLFTFAYISIALGDWPEKTLVWFMSENVLPMFSSRNFMVSCLLLSVQAILSLFLCVVWGTLSFCSRCSIWPHHFGQNSNVS